MLERPGDRVLVTGMPAAGKTTLARELAQQDRVPFVEADRLYYGPGFVRSPSYLEDLATRLAGPRWYLDDVGYPESLALVWQSVDAVVWLDLPFGLTLARAVRRTWQRLRSSEEVFPGCRETWTGWARAKHPVRMALTQQRRRRRATEQRLARHPDLRLVRLRTPREVEDFLSRRTTRT